LDFRFEYLTIANPKVIAARIPEAIYPGVLGIEPFCVIPTNTRSDRIKKVMTPFMA
jgi:hypothetical protein